mgnify:CR=1 FL=1
MSNRTKAYLIAVVSVLILIVLIIIKPVNLPTEYSVIRVVDGDTLIVSIDGKDETVRLIGIDAPESVHPDTSRNSELGMRSAEYAKELLEGQKVRIELDAQERDRYGRLLAYVYLGDVMVNVQMVEAGMAVVATYPPNVRFTERFVEAERRAREKGVGLWE